MQIVTVANRSYRTGVLNVRSALHPLFNLAHAVQNAMSYFSHQKTNGLLSPFISIILLFPLFLFCSRYVAHRQFFGEYGPLLSIRSSACLLDGGSPISFLKFKNPSIPSHRLQIEIPRPPYLGYDLRFLSKTRCLILAQYLYNSVSLPPCVFFLFEESSAARHPQLFVSPIKRRAVLTKVSFPHSQRQSHRIFGMSLFLASTVNLLNFLPII